MKRLKWILPILAIIPITLVGLYVYITFSGTPVQSAVNIPQDPELLNVAKSVGINTDDLTRNSVTLVYANKADITAKSPGTAEAQGLLSVQHGKSGAYMSSELRVLKDAPNIKETIAHEYLHLIWATDKTVSTDPTLNSKLTTEYGKNTALREETSWYTERSILSNDELFAITCTRYSDIDPYIIDYCNKYISRSALTLK